MAEAKKAAPAKVAKGAKKGRWNLYEKAGDKVPRKNKACPKGGQGNFMAKHANRTPCGPCHYTEFSKKE